jgi:hypothetical protein
MRANADKVIEAQAEAAKCGAVTIWTIYDRPKDHPQGLIARMHLVAKGRSVASDWTIEGELAEIRDTLHMAGLVRLERDSKDDARIVESWV